MLDGTFQTPLGKECSEVWNRSRSRSGAGTMAGCRDTGPHQQGNHPSQGINIQKLKLKDLSTIFFVQIKFRLII